LDQGALQYVIEGISDDTYQGAESNNLENTLHWKESSEDNVEILEHCFVSIIRPMELQV